MIVRVPGPLRSYTGERAQVEAAGTTLRELLDGLDAASVKHELKARYLAVDGLAAPGLRRETTCVLGDLQRALSAQ